MKTLKDFLLEDGGGLTAPVGGGVAAGADMGGSGIYATPGVTMGMGNPLFPGQNNCQVGSGDSFNTKRTAKTKKRKEKHVKFKSEV